MTGKDLRDSDKGSAKNVNTQKSSSAGANNDGKKNMPCKKSLPT